MILTTKRLVLREIEEQDWRAVLAYLSHPLYLRYNPWTHRAELEKIGMRQEGRLRENEWMKGRWWDTLLYAILEHEWQTGGEGLSLVWCLAALIPTHCSIG